MDAKELMVGDLIRFPHCEPIPDKYLAVHAIKYDYKFTNSYLLDIVFCDSGVIQYNYTLRSIEPIPLTPEILEKNGFRKLVTYGTEKWLCDNFRLNIYSSDGTWRFCADTNRNENSVIYIRFVHELQHALRLCGIEKEIVL